MLNLSKYSFNSWKIALANNFYFRNLLRPPKDIIPKLFRAASLAHRNQQILAANVNKENNLYFSSLNQFKCHLVCRTTSHMNVHKMRLMRNNMLSIVYDVY